MSTPLEPHVPPLELLKAVHTFPGPFVFKAIGQTADDFESRVVEVVREELGLSAPPRSSTRVTSSGSRVAVTVEALATKPEQVQAAYRRLATVEGLVILL